MALLRPLIALSDVADLAGAAGLMIGDVYQRQAARQIIEDMLGEQARLTRRSGPGRTRRRA